MKAKLQPQLIEYKLDRRKLDITLERLRMYQPPEGYWLGFSGGKDSTTLKTLAQMAGVKFTAHFNITGLDPPEVIKFTKTYHPDVILEPPPRTLWELIPKWGPPTRLHRWCCQELKERTPPNGAIVALGIRAAESRRRATYTLLERCYRRPGIARFHPIIDWTDADIWAFIREYNIPYCSLYDEGWVRVSCLMCPFARLKERPAHAARYPNVALQFVRAFDRLLQQRPFGQSYHIKTPAHLFMWWMEKWHKGDPIPTEDDALNLIFPNGHTPADHERMKGHIHP